MEKIFRISNREIINAVAGVLFEMHPYNNPEGIGIIVEKLIENINSAEGVESVGDPGFKLFNFDSYESLYNFINKCLMDIDEFKQLNISRKLKEEGVTDCEDERNKGFKFTDRYSSYEEDDRYIDFIDLDAAIQNIARQIIVSFEMGEDCFLCKFAKDYGGDTPGSEICNTCICNPKMKFNRVPHPMALKPHSEWTEEEKQLYGMM